MDISKLLEVEVKEGKPSELPENGQIAPFPDFSVRDIASVRFRKLHCTACDVHIGSAPADAPNMQEHPVLRVLLCAACRDFYGDGSFEQGDDATDMFCRWCANGGNLYCCSFCSNTFCSNCIKRNFESTVRRKIERDEKWKCFVCNPADLYTARAACWALLQHVQTVTRILHADPKMTPREIEAKMQLDESQCCPHRKVRKPETEEPHHRPKRETSSEMEVDMESFEEEDRPQQRKRRRTAPATQSASCKRKTRSFIKRENPEFGDNLGEKMLEYGARLFGENYTPEAPRNRSEEAAKSGKNRRSAPAATVAASRNPIIAQARPRGKNNLEINGDEDIFVPLLECDQSMVEGNESLNFGGEASPEKPENPGPGMINAVPVINLLRRTGLPGGPNTRGGKTHRLVRGADGTPILVRKIAPVARMENRVAISPGLERRPMVAIPGPNRASSPNNRSGATKNPARRVTRRSDGNGENSRRRRRSGEGQPPSMINLASDEEDPVESQAPPGTRQNSRIPELSTLTHPVRPDDGLLTILSNPESSKTSNKRERSRLRASEIALEEALNAPEKSIDLVHRCLRTNLRKVMFGATTTGQPTIFSGRDKPEEVAVAKVKTRAIAASIKLAIDELNSMNESIVHAYHVFKRERNEAGQEEEDPEKRIKRLEKREKSWKYVSLDMECWHESEPEYDDGISDQESPEEKSPTTETPQTFFPLPPFRRRTNRSVEARPQTRNRGCQTDDHPPLDYEKSIGYSLLLKADYDEIRERDVLRAVRVPDENFHKYHEEYYKFLQDREDDKREEGQDPLPTVGKLPTVDELPIVDIIEADLERSRQRENLEVEKNAENLKNFDDIVGDMVDENMEIFEEHLEILTTKSLVTDRAAAAGSSPHSNSSEKNNFLDVSRIVEDRIRALDAENQGKSVYEKVLDEDDVALVSTSAPDTIEGSEILDSSEKIEVHKATRKQIFCVRALVEEKNDGEMSSKNSENGRKSAESDDECTILD